MTKPTAPSGLRSHHIVMAVVAILIAVALAGNYYLW
jgi:hypothetical protein